MLARTDHGDDNGRRGRINSSLVGDPGTAKSILARESARLNPNSRYVNAQNASATSFVGMVDKYNDGYFLRLGLAPLARNAICAVNEIGLMSLEDQGHLTDIAEEGKTTLSKYSLHFDIDAPTTIIATANPLHTKWDSRSSISKDEMPILKTLLDRADQVYGLRDSPSEQEIREYTRQKTRLRKRKPHNYNFLKKTNDLCKKHQTGYYQDRGFGDLTGQQTIFENSESQKQNENMHGDESGSYRSHRSHEHEYSCNYCSFQTHNETDYNRHVVIKHPGKPGYNERNGRTS